MATYLLTFRSPKDYNPTPETAAAWSAWHQSLGARRKDRGNPVFRAETVGAGPGQTVLGGYSLVRAQDLATAVAMAMGCPGLEAGMGIEIGEVTNLDDRALTPARERPVIARRSAALATVNKLTCALHARPDSPASGVYPFDTLAPAQAGHRRERRNDQQHVPAPGHRRICIRPGDPPVQPGEPGRSPSA